MTDTSDPTTAIEQIRAAVAKEIRASDWLARELGIDRAALEAFALGEANLAPAVMVALAKELTESTAPARPRSTERTTMLTAKSLKVVVPLDPAEVSSLRAPPTARVMLDIQVAGGAPKVKAEVATKSLKKAQATIREHGADGCAAFIQGKLTAGGVVVEAGLVAQVKVVAPKAQSAVEGRGVEK